MPVSTRPPPPTTARFPREHSSQVHPWTSLATNQDCSFPHPAGGAFYIRRCSLRLFGDVTTPGAHQVPSSI